jgi:hypothetical protein
MSRYYRIECPRCEGSGKIRLHLFFERTCPLCCGAGTILDYEHPMKIMPQPASEIKMVRPKTAVELLATVTPLGRKPSSSLVTRVRSGQSTADLLGEDYAPIAGTHFEPEEAEEPPQVHEAQHRQFVEGATPDRRNFRGRMRPR